MLVFVHVALCVFCVYILKGNAHSPDRSPLATYYPGIWAKHSNFHLATNAPFAIHVPGTQPQVSPQYAEFVDLFPTIVEAATGASMPACPKRSCNVKFCTQGVSLLPHIKDHRLGHLTRVHRLYDSMDRFLILAMMPPSWLMIFCRARYCTRSVAIKTAAFSQYPRCPGTCSKVIDR